MNNLLDEFNLDLAKQKKAIEERADNNFLSVEEKSTQIDSFLYQLERQAKEDGVDMRTKSSNYVDDNGVACCVMNIKFVEDNREIYKIKISLNNKKTDNVFYEMQEKDVVTGHDRLPRKNIKDGVKKVCEKVLELYKKAALSKHEVDYSSQRKKSFTSAKPL